MDEQTENTIEPTPGAAAADAAVDADTLNRLTVENEQLKTAIRLEQARRQITDVLAKAGARSPELLFDSVKGDLQFADDGAPANTAALVDRLKTGFPEQFGSRRHSAIDAGAGQAAGSRLTKEALSRMKPEQIAKLDWADVGRALKN